MRDLKKLSFQELKNITLTMDSPEEDFQEMNISLAKVQARELSYAQL